MGKCWRVTLVVAHCGFFCLFPELSGLPVPRAVSGFCAYDIYLKWSDSETQSLQVSSNQGILVSHLVFFFLPHILVMKLLLNCAVTEIAMRNEVKWKLKKQSKKITHY